MPYLCVLLKVPKFEIVIFVSFLFSIFASASFDTDERGVIYKEKILSGRQIIGLFSCSFHFI